MTAVNGVAGRVKGLSGHVFDRMTTEWWTTSDVADASSTSLSQAGTCLARLVRLGLVEKGDRHASGLRLWRKVDRPAAFKVGDRVRLLPIVAAEFADDSVIAASSGRVGVLKGKQNSLHGDWWFVEVEPSTTWGLHTSHFEHAPADPIAPRAWTPQRRPDTPWHLRTPLQQRGVAP